MEETAPESQSRTSLPLEGGLGFEGEGAGGVYKDTARERAGQRERCRDIRRSRSEEGVVGILRNGFEEVVELVEAGGSCAIMRYGVRSRGECVSRISI